MVRVPAPALVLVAAAVASTYVRAIRDAVNLHDVEHVVTVALILVLFEGGLQLGRRRFRDAALPILALGAAGTFATTAVIAVAAHLVFGLDWRFSFVLGAALAPTDPAVVFSLLANRTIPGRTPAILEGESGFNDPAGIALLLGFAQLAVHPQHSIAAVFGTFALQMAVGCAFGVAVGLALRWLLHPRRPALNAAQSLIALAAIFALYVVTAFSHGSGFLAVFVAGIVLDEAAPATNRAIARIQLHLPRLGEIVAFVMLGVTVDLHTLPTAHAWLIGLGLFALLTVIIRPAVCLPLLALMSKRETAFIAWSGLKGAVPMLLGVLAVSGGVPDSTRLLAIVFVVVVASIVVQGGALPWVAHKLHLEASPGAGPSPDR
jgi:cell volume regulation protein A